ncbi:cytochrome d ubiquinol oxidase subunit II [Curtobacterium sp. MCPF17_047]|uniref:cytochrome d ubiquinol oxidase subunit II n=1 Tax=unclassified Curtobacterium TaxID=257496 RepID=UPI000DAA3F69|nr:MULTISPECIES: cytochrome d ubiquinol oxidase subunit II [unclassified Curtobacterium]PZE61104.1 cytochrome d ubiquinol oxidase subunit II [Curtobacterium sp. MCPF17_001]PZF66589.1 cytochrome d ubiquinol oxidase subunit II [Curtobacterium sp. MCPF17_047]
MDLPVLWFAIVGLFFVGYFVLDGFDFGVGMSLPFLGRDDTDRRVLINTIGPVWDLNETWVIVAGACLFAAFPEWYATMFSGFYLALLLILAALILRGVSFEYRHQDKHLAWKRRFDLMIVVGSAVPSFLWGVAFGNVVRGIPMDAGHNYTGTLFDLLNPFALLAGATTLLVFFTHGVVFVALKTEGEMRERAMRLAKRAGVVTIVVAAVFLVTMALVRSTPTSLVLSAVGAVALVVAVLCAARGREGRAFTLMAVTIAAVVLAMFTAVFPDVMPATNDPANSLTVANASSGTYTLTVMSWVALVCIPLVLAYQAWTYWVFRKRVSRATVAQAAH